MQTLAPLVLPPRPRIVPAPLEKDDKYLAPPEIFFASPPGCVEIATGLVLWLESVNLLAPENKITLKEKICFPQKFTWLNSPYVDCLA